jgi:hypothetical protein
MAQKSVSAKGFFYSSLAIQNVTCLSQLPIVLMWLFCLLLQAKTAFVHLASYRIIAHWRNQDEDWENNVLILVDRVVSE